MVRFVDVMIGMHTEVGSLGGLGAVKMLEAAENVKASHCEECCRDREGHQRAAGINDLCGERLLVVLQCHSLA